MRIKRLQTTLSLLCGFACVWALFFTTNASALESDPQKSDYSTVHLATDVTGVGTTGTLDAVLSLELQQGWHAFWRMPGEGGLPPKLDWAASQNVKTVALQWPVPQRFETAGMSSFGYTGTVLFPLSVTVAEAGKPVTLAGAAEIMVCKDICIPQRFTLSLAIPAGPAKPVPNTASIVAQAKTALPHQGSSGGLRIDGAVIGPKALVVNAWSQKGFKDADLFAEVKDGLFYFTARPVIDADKKDPRSATIALTPPDGTGNLANALMHHSVTLTLVQGGQAIEKAIDF